MPVEEGKTSSGWQPKMLGDGFARGAGRVQAGLAGGAVGVAGVDGDNAQPTSGGAQVLLVDNEGRGGDAVGGEGGGGACWHVSHNEGKVGATALLEPGLGGAKTKTTGKKNWETSDILVIEFNPFNLAGGRGEMTRKPKRRGGDCQTE